MPLEVNQIFNLAAGSEIAENKSFFLRNSQIGLRKIWKQNNSNKMPQMADIVLIFVQ